VGLKSFITNLTIIQAERKEIKMEKAKLFFIVTLVFFLGLFMLTPSSWCQKITLSHDDITRAKAVFDDPKPLYKELPLSKVLPPDSYRKLVHDPDAMKSAWADVLGFRAPDVVGKIAPEIKPGTYTYQDRDKYPGLKELMLPGLWKHHFKPGGPPFVGNFTEFKIVPTRQYYWALPIAKATKENMGRTKLDNQGYVIEDSYVSGYPFPRPSGEFKAQQIVYNWKKRYSYGDNMTMYALPMGFNKNLKIDSQGAGLMTQIRFKGRAFLEPYGWLDKRAQDLREDKGTLFAYLSPRDLYGNAFGITYYSDANKSDNFILYVSAIRRVRKMSATDTQDNVGGQDGIYDDNEGFDQKLSPDRYPYKYEVIAEREYLVPVTLDGAPYVSSKKGYEFVNLEFERRPMYVVQLTQLDKNYIYSKRILYFDKEMFNLLYSEDYDRKGRLYRTNLAHDTFNPGIGLMYLFDGLQRDYVDLHSTYNRFLLVPTPGLGRDDVDIYNFSGKTK
jgi:hypothetical protein